MNKEKILEEENSQECEVWYYSPKSLIAGDEKFVKQKIMNAWGSNKLHFQQCIFNLANSTQMV